MTFPHREATPDREALLAQAEREYERALDSSQLSEVAGVVPLLRAAYATTPLDHPAGVWCRLSLAAALMAGFQVNTELITLDEAAAVLTEVAVALPSGDRHRQVALSNLGAALAARYGYHGEPADLTQAIEVTREALAAEPYNARLLASLCGLLARSHRRSAIPAELDEAIEAGEKAVRFAPAQATYRAQVLSDLGTARLERYRKRADPADLDAAIALLEQALALLPPDAVERVSILAMATGAWRDRFKARGDRADIDRAIDAGRFLWRLGPQLPYLTADFVTGLGVCLRLRAIAFDREEDMAEAIAVWRAAAASPGTARMRFLAAIAAAMNQSERGRPAEAVDDYATAVQLMPLLAWRGLDRAARAELLGNYPGVAPQAAASAIAAGDPDRGIELLEQGRSVLWRQLLETRTDLTTLHEAHPDLATRLDRLRSLLDQPGGTPASPEI